MDKLYKRPFYPPNHPPTWPLGTFALLRHAALRNWPHARHQTRKCSEWRSFRLGLRLAFGQICARSLCAPALLESHSGLPHGNISTMMRGQTDAIKELRKPVNICEHIRALVACMWPPRQTQIQNMHNWFQLFNVYVLSTPPGNCRCLHSKLTHSTVLAT